ncbi:MAG: hypothetical protein ABI779_16995 [Acidobacteriota bacterium]
MRVLARGAAVIATSILCGWAFVHWVYNPLACNAAITDLTRRTALITDSPGDYQRIARARRNIEALHELRAMCPMDVRVPMLLAANEEALGRLDDAVRSYRDALNTGPRPEIQAALGDALIQLGRTEEAVEQYVTAARFNPNMLELLPSEEVRRRVEERVRAGH